MAIDPIVEQRMFRGVYICMRCKARNRAASQKVRAGKVHCRKCGYDVLRARKKGSAKGKAA
jgi:ribosomal protein L40E